MDVSLVHVHEDGRKQDIPLKRPVQVIGRQTDVAIRIPSASVSRHHCEVAVSDGAVTIKDLGSSNGTFINKARVTQARLKPGDLIAVGQHVFVLRVDGVPDDIDAEDAFDTGYVAPASGATPSAAPAAAPRAAAAPAAGGNAAPRPAPAKKPLKSLTDDDDDDLVPRSGQPASSAPSDEREDSSVADFDFLDEDDDMKKQPKL